ncbi:hypothetical protein JXB27_03595, partial [Candidatus Woesearchaeota archaeon]|nr:hypothetical protein [Candidatus Woesearchaeota archaeon]
HSPHNEPGYYAIEATPNVGILKSPLKFDLKEGLIIPAENEQYVSKRSRGFSREFWEINKGNMRFHCFELMSLDHKLHAGLTSADPSGGLSLYFGNKAVEEQFKKDPDAERYRRMLGDELIEKLAKTRKKPEFIDGSYARALQILGAKEIPADFKEAYVKEMLPKAQSMLLDLQGHAVERATLLKKIDDTRKSAKDGKITETNFDYTHSYSVPVEEHLAPTKRAVAEVEGKIKSSLEDVARLGIPQFDLVIQQGLQGAPFDLSKELYLMCEQFGVDPKGIEIKRS